MKSQGRVPPLSLCVLVVESEESSCCGHKFPLRANEVARVGHSHLSEFVVPTDQPFDFWVRTDSYQAALKACNATPLTVNSTPVTSCELADGDEICAGGIRFLCKLEYYR